MDRRRFIGKATAAAFALGALPTGFDLGASANRAGASGVEGEAPASGSGPLRILVLGGTGFIGPHQVRYALSRGHTLTLFNRGCTNTHLFPEVENLVGDRDGHLEALEGRRWDAVLDNSGFEPRIVRNSARLLSDSVARYVFLSTESVYADRGIIDQDETGALELPPLPEERWSGYGPLKALCEWEVREAFPGRSTIIRPPAMVGPGDGSDRFTHWVTRVARGGEVLAPGGPDDLTHFVDVRDVAEFTVRCLEDGVSGVYNTTGPGAPLSMSEMLYGIRAVTESSARFTWVDAPFLAEHDVRGFSDMPLWYPPVGRTAGFLRMNPDKAQAKGLTYRRLAVTASETLDWWKSQPAKRRAHVRAGVSAGREVGLLAAWHARG